MTESKGYVNAPYLQAAAAQLQATKQRSYAAMHVHAGQTVLDVGCGPGIDTCALAALVGSTGLVAGVDHDPAMIAAADARAAEAGVAAWVRHEHARAQTIPFADATFDASRSERVFQHLHAPEQTLAEMYRVTRAGGWVVVVDTDWGTFSIDTPEIELERRLARVYAERCLHNGYAGRQLYRLFQHQGFAEVAIELVPSYTTSYGVARQLGQPELTEQTALAAGALTPDELEHWQAALHAADSAGRFFASVTLIMVAGRV